MELEETCNMPVWKLMRKRSSDLLMEKTPSVKLQRLSTSINCNENNQWPTEVSLTPKLTNGVSCEPQEEEISNDPSIFRRFSTRDRKRTEFFTPKSIDEKTMGTELGRHHSRVFESARRSLKFNTDPNIVDDDIGQGTEVGGHEHEHESIPNPITTMTPKLFPIGSLVWGKLPGYDWWPGCVISYDKKEIEKFKDEIDTDDDDIGSLGEVDESDDVVWIKWFGDNQLSLLLCRKLKSFGQFNEFFFPSKLKGLYKKAMFAVLREAAKRCHVDVLFKNEDKKLSWAFHSMLCSQLTKKNTTDPVSSQYELDEPNHSEIFTNVSLSLPTSPHESEASVVDSKKKGNKKGVVYLTGEEKYLLEWAINGFLPSGAQGFKPKPEHLLDVKIVPIGPKTEQDTTYLPTGRAGNKRSKKEGGRGSMTEADKEKLMVIETTRNKAQFVLVAQGQIDIEDICIGCGRTNIVVKHPLFHGGLCTYCKDMFMECAYLFDDDGTQMYCTICSAGNEVFMCDTPNCSKVYCGVCIEKLCGPAELTSVSEAEKWQCYMCSSPEGAAVGLMKRRENWDKELHDLFLNDNEMEFDPPQFYPPICAEDRKPIKVLGLFDGIGTGLLVLKELGIEVDLYIASEIDPDAVKVSRVNHGEMRHVGAIEYITEKEVKAWGPFDLVIGGSPCNDLSIVNPARKGIYDGTGRLFFEFYRILEYAKPHPDDPRPFFWMFENVVSMRATDKQIISRFLQCNPVVVDARDISAAHRARFFWGNLPGMNRPTVPLPSDRLSLQSCLEPNCFRTAQFNKLRTVTTKMNSIKQTKKAIFPVKVVGEEEDGDVLWCTEMERLFGFPSHYTDIGNLGRCGRQKLLGKAWSVPVARHLLSPLKNYFKSRTTGIPSSVKFGASSDATNAITMPTVANSDEMSAKHSPPYASVATPAQPQLVKAMVEIEVTKNTFVPLDLLVEGDDL